jgi:hypothetical protein
MHPEMRARFNADFTPDKYAALVDCVNTTERWPANFRMSETPIFLTSEFNQEVQRAAHKIVNLLQTPEFVRHSKDSVPSGWEVPNESAHPNFLVVDFGICSQGDRLVPRLIELQAFPSLYGFQLMMLDCLRKSFPAVPRYWTSSFGGIKDEQYLELLRRTIVGTADPKNVVLLEIEPEKQKTRVDFAATGRLLGIETVSLTAIKKQGRTLLYDHNGTDIPIRRIYNRVIFDDLMRRPDLVLPFRFQDDLDVKWVGHPNWYFRISKHSLPFLKTEHTSAAFFADELPAGEDVSEYVLKPLFSFAGLGVDMEPTPAKLKKVRNPHEWILQEKVAYAEFVPTPDGPKSKAEIRMMFLWPEEDEAPTLVNNLVRMSQGKMMGVDFNKEKTWVGSSIALHQD